MAARPMLFRCDECGWTGTQDDICVVSDPKEGSEAKWSICPQCRSAEQFTNMCDEPGCSREASCGFPSVSGYRRTCFEHWTKPEAA